MPRPRAMSSSASPSADAPFVAALLDAVAQADDADRPRCRRAGSSLRREARAARFELRLEARAFCVTVRGGHGMVMHRRDYRPVGASAHLSQCVTDRKRTLIRGLNTGLKPRVGLQIRDAGGGRCLRRTADRPPEPHQHRRLTMDNRDCCIIPSPTPRSTSSSAASSGRSASTATAATHQDGRQRRATTPTSSRPKSRAWPRTTSRSRSKATR